MDEMDGDELCMWYDAAVEEHKHLNTPKNG